MHQLPSQIALFPTLTLHNLPGDAHSLSNLNGLESLVSSLNICQRLHPNFIKAGNA
jgi:hypothetical protein